MRNQLTQLFEDAPLGYQEIDRDGVIRRVNRANCQLLGYPQSELVGKHVWELLTQEPEFPARESLRQKLDGERDLCPFEREYERPDGTRIHIEIHENLIRDEHGSVCGLRAALLDITERKRMQQDMHRDWEWFTLRSIGEGVLAADAVGKVIFMNQAAEALLGINEANALGRDITKVFRLVNANGEVQREWPMRRIIDEGTLKNWSEDLRLTCAGGETRAIQTTISPIADKTSLVLGAVLIFRTLNESDSSPSVE